MAFSTLHKKGRPPRNLVLDKNEQRDAFFYAVFPIAMGDTGIHWQGTYNCLRAAHPWGGGCDCLTDWPTFFSSFRVTD